MRGLQSVVWQGIIPASTAEIQRTSRRLATGIIPSEEGIILSEEGVILSEEGVILSEEGVISSEVEGSRDDKQSLYGNACGNA